MTPGSSPRISTAVKGLAAGRLARVDGLRAAAILGVIAVHAGMAFRSPWGATALGKHGVELFFLISGFILMHVAARPPFDAGRFLVRRFFRLAPLYYAVLLVCYAVGFNERLEVGVAARGNDLANALWHISFLHGLHPQYVRSVYSVAWSLTPEVVFYLLFPLLVGLDTRRLLAVLAGCMVLGKVFPPLAFHFLGYSEGVSIWAQHSPMFSLYLFVFGMLVYRHPEFFRRPVWTWVGVAGAGLFAWHGAGLTLGPVTRAFETLAGDKFHWFVAMAFPLAVYADGRVALRVLDNRLAGFVGRISYSAFFIHLGVIHWLMTYWTGHQEMPYLVGVAVVLAITLPLSYLSFVTIEQGGIRLGRWMMGHAPARAGLAAA